MRLTLTRWLLLGVAATTSGCIKKAPLPQDAGTTVLVATVLGSTEDDSVGPLPAAAVERLLEELSARNLTPRPAPDVLYGAFDKVRATSARFEALEAHAADGEGVLLVECDARFSTQVNGRFRWNVEGQATIAVKGANEDGILVEPFDVPVHLVYYHQRETEAAADAAPVVARQLGRLLDGFVESRAN